MRTCTHRPSLHRAALLCATTLLVAILPSRLGAQSEAPATGSPAPAATAPGEAMAPATTAIEHPEANETPDTPAATPPSAPNATAPRTRPSPRPVPSDDRIRQAVRQASITPASRRDEPERLNLPGLAGAWFYRPSAGGRQRALVYLHSRNANPREACRRWHESTPRFGWLICPIGPVDRGNGRREWRNNAEYARRESIAAIEALQAQMPRRIRRHDNVIMGFSEGAYAAMNVGLMEPLTFPRWFIIAANDLYIDGEDERMQRANGPLRRIFLLTGQHDEIVQRSHRAYNVLSQAFGRRRVRLRVLPGAAHELPPDFRSTTRNVLLWVTQ